MQETRNIFEKGFSVYMYKAEIYLSLKKIYSMIFFLKIMGQILSIPLQICYPDSNISI